MTGIVFGRSIGISRVDHWSLLCCCGIEYAFRSQKRKHFISDFHGRALVHVRYPVQSLVIEKLPLSRTHISECSTRRIPSQRSLRTVRIFNQIHCPMFLNRIIFSLDNGLLDLDVTIVRVVWPRISPHVSD